MLKYTVPILFVLFTANCGGADRADAQWVMDPLQEKFCGELCDYCAQQVTLCNPPPEVYSRDLCMEVIQVQDMSAVECRVSLMKKRGEVSVGSFCGYLKDDNCWVKTVLDPWWN